ncbi:MAG: hypothetical protein KJZ84_07185 [Bryobacteraceae bacterium]|nr:hypothetical protein [Bryobacteraceae bacterium]
MAVIICHVEARFDNVIVVDWSARSRPAPARPSRDAIWWSVNGEEPQYERTRQDLEAQLTQLLIGTKDRLLVGFDFCFSYPRWFLEALGVDWRGLWTLLAAAIQDTPHANNRFEAAAALNRRATGRAAPFWGAPVESEFLKRRKPPSAALGAQLRDCEAALRPRPKSAFQLLGAGSVGSQTLLGIPLLERLRRRFAAELRVWPFEPPDARIVLAEVYPSLLPKRLWSGAPIPDREQVRHLAAALRRGAVLDRQTFTPDGGILRPP